MIPSGIPLISFVLFLLAGLTFTVFNDPYIRRSHRTAMLIIIALCLSLVVQNYVENWLSEGEPRITIRTLTAIFGYIVRPLIIIMFFHIVAPKKKFYIGWLLVGLNTVIHSTALFSDICFKIDSSNHYQGGPLRYTCLVVSLLLLIYLLYLTISEYIQSPKREIAIPVLIIVMIMLGTWLDGQVGIAPQPITYLTVSMAVSCTFYYIWLHMQFVREHEADLKARQRIRIAMSQIQPHFLYNTLSAIQVLCHTDPEKAADVTEHFSTYLRDNLTSMDLPGLIPFRKELEHTRTYVQIEEIRFPSIHVTYDIQDDLFQLPPLTLQPMVENAIRHGVRIREEGLVDVISRRNGDMHEIVIRDNGKGFDPIEALEDPEKHIGIRNVRDRVETMCSGTVEVDSRIDEGTTVTIRIPAVPENEVKSS